MDDRMNVLRDKYRARAAALRYEGRRSGVAVERELIARAEIQEAFADLVEVLSEKTQGTP